MKILLYVSPLYRERPPVFSPHWRSERDSPAWVWLRLSDWPPGRTIHAPSVPLRPKMSREGKVDIIVSVSGLGAVRDVTAEQRVPGFPKLLRLGTVEVRT